MYKIVVTGKVGAGAGETIDLPPYGRVKVVMVNLPDNKMEIEVLD